MIQFSVDNLHLDGPVTNHCEALLRVVGDFSVEMHGSIRYAEQDFCILEFLRALMRWRGRLDTEPAGDFEYQSMESAEPWLLRVSQLQNGLWQLETWDAVSSDHDRMRLAEFDAAAATLVDKVAKDLPEGELVVNVLRGSPENASLATALARARAVRR
ncbi:DUF7878 domain-containing protein [Sorangium sp. So ce1151]|uniref:DUF7878 domain-containing protein n=1 Tax=Sorangium sp. So ce1151 TaxID=3133332 RepID=UPI003F5F14CA